MLKTRKINKSPQRPGVYFFQNKKGEIIYIGKAKNLRARLYSHFKKIGVKPLTKETVEINWQETESDIDALILEAKLIKEKQPKYNVRLRDDKQYFYVAVTQDNFPKIFITHQKDIRCPKDIGCPKYLGPFTDGAALKTTLKLLRRIFPYCACKSRHPRPCVQSQLGLCFGICCSKPAGYKAFRKPGAFGKPNARQYQKNIKAIVEILTGQRKTLLKKLQKEMVVEAKKENFEKAAKLREEIFSLEKIFKHQKTIEKETGIENEKALIELKKLFGFKKIPERIEGYDVSNLGGKNAVGSMIVFTNSQADKKEYKRFLIKTKQTPNLPCRQAGDTAMLKEVLSRRLKHWEWPEPDLIIVDGGKAQLNAALKIKTTNQKYKNIKIAALAKRNEELYIEDGRIVKLENLPAPLDNFLRQIRDEAHRFALNYYKLKRKRDLFLKN
ncbi:MAG: GIY-YIG nuclease family protein [Patescibacteria group bacterium]